jgi:hypothetical protein
VYWEDVTLDDGRPGHRCKREGHPREPFPRGEICQRCATDPGPAIEVEEVGGDDPQIRIWVNECDSLAKFCHRVGKDLAGGSEEDLGEIGHAVKERDCNAAAKLISEGTKLKRLAFEMREVLKSREHDLKLIAHEREMSGTRRTRH